METTQCHIMSVANDATVLPGSVAVVGARRVSTAPPLRTEDMIPNRTPIILCQNTSLKLYSSQSRDSVSMTLTFSLKRINPVGMAEAISALSQPTSASISNIFLTWSGTEPLALPSPKAIRAPIPSALHINVITLSRRYAGVFIFYV